MATLLDIKTLAASYLDLAPADFTVNGMDLFLAAANQVRKSAELEHDFEFNRKSVTVTVNGTTGGNLGLARDRDNNLVSVKTVIEVGLLDDEGNLIPTLWTTTAESLERQREDNGGRRHRLWRTDDEGDYIAGGAGRFTFSGDLVYKWPLAEETENISYALWLEAYCFTSDWSTAALSGDASVSGTFSPSISGAYTVVGSYNFYPLFAGTSGILFWEAGVWTLQEKTSGLTQGASYFTRTTTSTSPAGAYTNGGTAMGSVTVTQAGVPDDIWTNHGQQYLLWATIVQLNKRYKFFVPRQEGNLAPPTELADAGLAMLVDWDANKFEQFRRHSR